MNSVKSPPHPIVGVSACLLGHQVRYDGGHKKNAFITDSLSEHLELLPICPETEIGLGIPRPTIRLMGDIEHPRLVGTVDPTMDVTDTMECYSERQVQKLGELCGYILKKDSPSCGMERVKIYNVSGTHPTRRGSGVFARILMQRHPLLPVEEEGRLNDAVLRENFINRIFVMQRWRSMHQTGLTAARMIEFHTAHKYLVMAHSQAAYQRLGRLLSDLSNRDLSAIAQVYIEELMPTLKRRVTRRRHVNVLQHIMGYLKKHIESGDKVELSESIEAYRRGETPLVVPITLLRHYFRRHHDPYMEQQIYLRPYPEKLGLRNTI
ncbi:MAG: DUF523 and DUF1722 domain-containing protein [Candidatus Thiodiazotropha sp. (ex Monitilora ramsayi)]|nr:DUF523 and DUF1722 domain-containing protein [Candidatus Thiodiazotropha sp. (ex Monitilora ramsayi)]